MLENFQLADGQFQVNGQCVKRRVPGATCIANEQCLDESNCSNGYCRCANDTKKISTELCIIQFQILINGYCYDFAKIGQYCIDTVVCLGSSICYNNYCTCPGGTVAQNGYCQREEDCLENEIRVDGKCYPRVNIGQDCQFTQQCVSISTCQNGICICPPGTVSQNNICVPSGPCPTGQIYNAESCWDIAYIGEQCEFTQQCQGYSICIGGTCQCPDDTVVQDGLCIKEQCNSNEIMIDGICFNTVCSELNAKIDDFCYYTKQCQGNATCRRGKCTCPSGTVNSNDTCIVNPKCQSYQIFINDSCLDTVSIGMTCRDNSQCIGKNLINSDTRTCQCNNGTIFTGSKCLISPLQCPMSTVYIAGTICYPLVDIGQFCLYTIQCMGNSICSGQICKCPLGYSIIHNVCRRIN
uniref:EB domain-containing protein n=1 Tax=Elaeophora elaphi TaxID=1147741 RepID=A0A0R3S4D7_9BILA